jgi:hypothetical protein
LNRQWLVLDRLRALSYIAACALLAGCHHAIALVVPVLPPLIPAALPPADRGEALAWTGRMVPARGRAIRFRFLFQDKKRKVSGRGTARVAPPDSLRFDYVGPLGLGAGAAVVVGDSTVWADPEANFRSLVPGIPMLWAALGIVRPPARDAQVEGGVLAPRISWRFINGSDTLDYVATDGVPRILEGEWRREGKVLARSRTEFDARALPTQARVDFPEAPARFELTVVGVDTVATIAPALWRSRR